MAEVTRPLAIALTASLLLVAVVAVDASVNRTYELEVRDGERWRTVAGTGQDPFSGPRSSVVEVNRSENVTFRLTAENGYPWALEEEVTVLVHGRLVAENSLSVPSRSTGDATFTVAASELFSDGQAGGELPRPMGIFLEVWIGETQISGHVEFQEVER